jgi:hypothetical protein
MIDFAKLCGAGAVAPYHREVAQALTDADLKKAGVSNHTILEMRVMSEEDAMAIRLQAHHDLMMARVNDAIKGMGARVMFAHGGCMPSPSAPRGRRFEVAQ